MFCYLKMPFWLRNLGERTQRLPDKAFEHQIGETYKFCKYMDVMVNKIKEDRNFPNDIEETLVQL